jgi:Sec-independent protein translocase protein TatA
MGILNFIKNISPTEIVIIIVVLFVLFGSSTLVRMGKTGGETLKEIKNIKKSFIEAVKDDDTDTQSKGVSK